MQYHLFLAIVAVAILVILYLYRPNAPEYIFWTPNGHAIDYRAVLFRFTLTLLFVALAWLALIHFA